MLIALHAGRGRKAVLVATALSLLLLGTVAALRLG